MINSVKKAADVLFYLSNAPEEAVTLSKLSSELNINKATCAHMLDTLCDSLLVEHVSRRDGYRLGPGAYMLTRYGKYQESLLEICAPVMHWLNRKVNATVLLAVVCDGVKYIVAHVDSDEHLQYDDTQIIQGNISSTATGQLLMAYMDDDNIKRVLYRHTQDDAEYDIEKFEKRRAHIRSCGYAHVSSEDESRQTYAFRVWDGKRTVAAIGVLFDNSKDCPAMRNLTITKGMAAANEISRRLMFRDAGDELPKEQTPDPTPVCNKQEEKP